MVRKRTLVGSLCGAGALLLVITALPAAAGAPDPAGDDSDEGPPPGCSMDPATGVVDCPPGGIQQGPVGQGDPPPSDGSVGGSGSSSGGNAGAAPARDTSASGAESPARGVSGGGVRRVTLARTGFDAWILAAVGAVCAAGGLGLLVAQRRRLG